MRKFLVFPIALCSAEIITITDRFGRFPVSFLRDGNVAIEGFAAFDLSSHQFSYACDYQEDCDHVPGLSWSLRATSVSIGRDSSHTPIDMTFGEYVQYWCALGIRHIDVLERTSLPDVNHRLVMAASPLSLLAQSVSSFLMVPIGSSQSMIVFDPTDPTRFAFENQMFYSQLIEGRDWQYLYGNRGLWGVYTAIRFANSLSAPVDSSTQFIPCHIGSKPWTRADLQEPFIVPSWVTDEFLRIVDERELETETLIEDQRIIFLFNVDDAIIATLPSLQYIVQTTDGGTINVMTLDPNEYIGPADNANRRQVLLAQGGFQDYCNFNKPLRDRMVIHFDARNQRIGFGEPLIEL